MAGGGAVKRSPKRLVRIAAEDAIDQASERRTVALSAADLVVPRVHVEVIFAFEAPAPSATQLEEGLAATLVEFKEWAGRLSKDGHGRAVIALNGEGPAWIEAEAEYSLQSVMPFQPGWELMEYVPPNRGAEELLLVQVTRFSCGGITLGIARHHQVADGEAASAFMNAWAANVRGSPLPTTPLHDRSVLNARDPPQPSFEHIEYKKPTPPSQPAPESEKKDDLPPLSIKKIHFSSDMLKTVKSQAMKDIQGDGFYTTFESLTAHLWTSISRARGLSADTTSKAIVAVNGRKKLHPPIDENYFGNVIFHACSLATVGELLEKPLSYAASVVQKAIRGMDDTYMRSALDYVELQQRNPVPVSRGFRTILSPNLSITSWVQLPLYKLDFGHGTPLFAGPPLVPFEGLVILISSYTKDGSIDAVIALLAPDMAKLEGLVYDV